MVDDDRELCSLISEYLAGHNIQVDAEEDGERGLERALGGDYQLLVLDVMLPDTNGFEVLRKLRSDPGVLLPVIMLTAHGDEVDRIVGLELGADDYLSKPFNPRELLARIRAVLRRSKEGPLAAASPAATIPEQEPNEVLESGHLRLDVHGRQVWAGPDGVDLTQTEFDLLLVLLRQEGKVVQREDLTRQAMGRRLLPLDRSLDLHMSKLRRKLPENVSDRLRTVRGVGFMLQRPAPEGL